MNVRAEDSDAVDRINLTDTERAVLVAIWEGAEHAIDIWERAAGVTAASSHAIIEHLLNLGLIRDAEHMGWPAYALTEAGSTYLTQDADLERNRLKPPHRPPNRRLLRARQERGWSQGAVADRIHTAAVELEIGGVCVTGADIGRWERGERWPRPHYVQLLCRAFGASPMELGLVEKCTGKESGGPRYEDVLGLLVDIGDLLMAIEEWIASQVGSLQEAARNR